MKTSIVEVSGMLSALSARGVEKRLAHLPGVRRVEVNYVSGGATVEYDEQLIDIKRIIEHLRDRGLGVLITDHNVRELAQPFEELLRALGDYDLEAAESAVGALEERLHSPRLAEIKAWLADFDYSKAEALARALMIELNVPKCD